MNTKMVIALVALVIVAGGLVYWFSMKDSEQQATHTEQGATTTDSMQGMDMTTHTNTSSTGSAPAGAAAVRGDTSDASIANDISQIDAQMKAESDAQAASN